MKDKLITMTDFVLHEGRFKENDAVANLRITSYAYFLREPLSLGMFVPADEKSNAIVEPESYGWIQNCGGIDAHLTEDDYIECEKYHEAKSKVLFEGFEFRNPNKELYHNGKLVWFGELKGIVEDIIKLDITLTDYAKKLIYG